MAASSINMEHIETLKGRHRQAMANAKKNELLTLAVWELERSFHEQIQKIKNLLEGKGAVTDVLSYRRFSESASNYLICKSCRKCMEEEQTLTPHSGPISSHNFNIDRRLQNGLNRGNMSPEITSSSSGKYFEEKPNLTGTDLSITANSKEHLKAKRTFLLNVPESRKMRGNYINQKTTSRYPSKYARRRSFENGWAGETDKDVNFGIFNIDDSTTESPQSRPSMKLTQWSDHLGVEPHLSEDSLTYMERLEMKVAVPLPKSPTQGNESEKKSCQFESELWSDSSPSVIRTPDMGSTTSPTAPQMKEKPRGRQMQKFNGGSRKSKERYKSGWQLSVNTSRLESRPGTRRKSITPLDKMDCQSPNYNNGVRDEEDISPTYNIPDSEQNELVSDQLKDAGITTPRDKIERVI